MNQISTALQMPLKNIDQTLAKPLTGKQEETHHWKSCTEEEWIQSTMENCKRMDSDEEYRKAVVKRSF
ncbi:hypothetical protein AwPolaro_07720 [Polaromonas sp.]|nr:hypothetical protein AwPolaro_07720 [Polaromonas sp.]